MHHKHLNKEDGESFGMLWVARKYRKQPANRQQAVESGSLAKTS